MTGEEVDDEFAKMVFTKLGAGKVGVAVLRQDRPVADRRAVSDVNEEVFSIFGIRRTVCRSARAEQ